MLDVQLPSHPATDTARAHFKNATLITHLADGPRRTHWARQRDPRVLITFLVVMNVLGFSRAPMIIAAVCLVCVGLFLLLSVPRKFIAIWIVLVAVSLGLFYLSPLLFPHGLALALVFFSFWLLRFAIIGGAAIGVFYSLDLQRLSAVLAQMHAPSWFTITAQVVVRFFPVAINELKAIRNAMLLRGLSADAKGITLHPLKTGEYLLVPLLASSARIADELSAAAMLRGVGSPGRATSTITTRFTASDIFLSLLIIALLAFWAVVMWG